MSMCVDVLEIYKKNYIQNIYMLEKKYCFLYVLVGRLAEPQKRYSLGGPGDQANCNSNETDILPNSTYKKKNSSPSPLTLIKKHNEQYNQNRKSRGI